ncbi:MAG: hypothetical protein H5T76_22915 [Streptomyces sp.]|nr:hypothetical protein [Streptomyces sp.]
MRTRRVFSLLASGALVAAAGLVAAAPAVATSHGTSGDGVVPILVEGNAKCADFGLRETKFDNPSTGKSSAAPYGSQKIEIEITADLKYVDWTSTIGIDRVIVKGGDDSHVYIYNPEDTADTGLVSPLNKGDNIPQISHVSFCWDYNLEVSKTANTTYTRTWDWTILKSSTVTQPLVLAPGQTYAIPYSVTVSATSQDSNFAVSGVITIANPDPDNSATITSVTDTISPSGATATVACPSMTVGPASSIECTYSATLPGKDNGTNTVVVTTSGPVEGGTGTAPVTFGDPTTVVNNCISVTDNLAGALGSACSDESPKTFNYTIDAKTNMVPVDPNNTTGCGAYKVDNTATIVENGRTSSVTVLINIPCDTGCTLTQGYWKTHSKQGPAPYDDNWKNVGSLEEQTQFFNSGQTWHTVFWTAPAGNAYYVLAHQYMAAKLNVLNGASAPANVTQAIAEAETLLGGVSGTTLTKAQRTQALQLATVLDSYNNGLIGPAHCSE